MKRNVKIKLEDRKHRMNKKNEGVQYEEFSPLESNYLSERSKES